MATGIRYNLQTVWSAIDKISAPMKNIQAKLNQTASATERMKKSLSGVNKLLGFAGAAVGIHMVRSGLQSVINTGVELDKTLMSVGAKLGFDKFSDDYDRLNAKARELGASTIFSTNEVASAMDYLAMAGYNTVESIETAITPLTTIAQASNLAMDRAVDIVSDMESMTKHLGYDMVSVGDIFIKASDNANTTFEGLFDGFKNVGGAALEFGLSVEETAAALSLMADKSIKGGEAGNKLNRIMSNLKNPIGRTAKAIEQFGLVTTDDSGKLLGFADILQNLGVIYEDLGGRGSQAAQAFLSDIAGQEASTALANLLNSGPTAMRDFTAMLDDAAGAAANKAAKMAQTTDAKLKSVGSKWEELKLTMFGGMDAGLNSVLSAILDSMPGLTVGFNYLGRVLGVVFRTVGFGIKLLGNLLVDIQSLPAPVKWLGVAVLGLWAAFKGYLIIKKVMILMKAFAVLNPFGAIMIGIALVIAAVYLIWRYWDKLKVYFIKFWDKIKPPFVAFWQKIEVPIKAFWTFFVGYIKFVIKLWIAFYKVLFKVIVVVFKVIFRYLKLVFKFWVTYYKIMFKIVVAVIKGVVGLFAWLWKMVSTGAKWLWNVLMTVFNAVLSWIKSRVVEPLARLFSWLWTHVKNAWDSTWQALKAVFLLVWQWIDTNIIEPIATGFSLLWNGIVGAWDGAWELLKAALSVVVDWIQKYIIEPIEKAFSFLLGGIKNKFSKQKVAIEGEINDLTVRHNIAQTQVSQTTLNGQINVVADGAAQVTAATINQPNVVMNRQNRGRA